VAEVTAIGFTAPIFITIGAALFLGERLRARRIAAVVIGFLGTVVILQPGLKVIEPGALAQLASAPVLAVSYLLAKKLTETETSLAIVAYLSIFVTLALLPLAVLHWRSPTLEEHGLLFLTAVLATAGHYTLTRAMNATQITVLQPFQFLQLVWASLLGFQVFGEVPDPGTWIGGVIIVASATYIAHREARDAGGT
jgi:drug/metabolite transporter (DMT)-like permease